MMRIRALMATLLLVVLLLPGLASAQGFDSGSDGSDGDLNVTANTTITLPEDGILNYGTLHVAASQTLSFNRNALNTPIYILATGDILIEGTIAIDGASGASNPPTGGRGGPGGFDGGDPGIQDIPPGDGHGPGAGRGGNVNLPGTNDASAGAAAYGGVPQQPSASDGRTYGSPLLVPLVGGSGAGGGTGSGGGPGQGGSGGGGAILLASNTSVRITGAINARGGNNGFPLTNHGSGGAIRLVAPVVSGTGALRVNGQTGGVNSSSGDRGGAGRIRIDTIDRTDMRFTYEPLASLSVGGFMAVFPPVVPRLDIVEVAGRAIAPGAPAEILLPFGSSPNQTVRIRAADFVGNLPIEVVLVPSSGEREVYEADIDMNTDPDEVTVDVEIPVNTRTRVWAWSR